MTTLAHVLVLCGHRKGNAMKDYIKEGLKNYDAPPRIYENICKALEIPWLTDEERKELLRQKEKIKEVAIKTKDIFGFEP